MSRLTTSIRAVILLLLAAAPDAGCFVETTIPSCETLADCPAGEGYTGCVDGWCYREGACADRPVVSGDGCCALTEGDRSEDLDCLLRDMPLSCLKPAGPTFDSDGNAFVSCTMSSGDGTKNVVLRRLDVTGVLSVPLVVGPGTVAWSPLKGVGNTVIVQSSEGFVRYSSQTLAVLAQGDAAQPVAPMASNNGSTAARTISGWPAADGRVHLYDEGRNIVLAYGQSRPETGAAGAMRPSISWTGRRMYVTWRNGVLDVLETGSNPLGQVLSMQLPALPAGPAIDVDGMIYVPTVDGRLTRYRENARLVLDEVWSVDLFGTAPEQVVWLLVRDDNAIVAVGLSGEVRVVRDMDTFGSVVASGAFRSALAPVNPVLSESNRVVAVSDSGRIVSVLSEDADGVLAPGLEFAVPSRPASDLALQGNSLVYISETGSLTAWSYPEGAAAGRWTRAGANNGSTGRTAPPAAAEVNN